MPRPQKTPEEWLETRRKRWAEAFALVEQGKARPQVVECVELVKRGMGISEIAKALGLAKSTVGQRLSDPTDERNRARKARQGGTCEECGKPTSYRTGGSYRFCSEHNPVWDILHERARARTERMLAMRKRGMLNTEIAEREGISRFSVGTLLQRSRVARFGLEYVESPYHKGENRGRNHGPGKAAA